MTVRTRTELNSDADTYIDDNTVGGVTPADVRQRIKDLADSALLAEDSPGDVSKTGTPANDQIGVWTGDGTIEGTSALTFNGQDLVVRVAVNDANPCIELGSSADEQLHITSYYDTGAQTLDYVGFHTDVASATANKGLFRFSPDGVAVLDIDDGGINLAASMGISIAGTDILTDAAGTATLSNIDALDATTEATIEAAIDTLANLTSIQGVSFTFGAYAATLLNTANEAAFKTAVNLEIGVDVQAYDADTLKGDVENQTITGGGTVTSKSLGTQSSGTLTLDMGDRPLQHYTNNGAHTLAPGSVNGASVVDITNGASAGAITTSGWTKVAGDSFTTTNGHKFRCHCSVGNAGSLLVVQALQ